MMELNVLLLNQEEEKAIDIVVEILNRLAENEDRLSKKEEIKFCSDKTVNYERLYSDFCDFAHNAECNPEYINQMFFNLEFDKNKEE